MADHITHDPIYNTVDRDDFAAMMEVDRYGERTGAFDKIIAATHDHFWDPTDPAYLDFTEPFHLTEQTLLPRSMVIELNCAVADKLDEAQQIRLANESTHFMLSSILHGEQGALSLSASLCMILRDPGAQEYAANQTREEARHVTAFTRYIDPAFADRSINVRVDAKGRGKLYFGDRQFRYMRVIQTDYIGAPGSLRGSLRMPARFAFTAPANNRRLSDTMRRLPCQTNPPIHMRRSP